MIKNTKIDFKEAIRLQVAGHRGILQTYMLFDKYIVDVGSRAWHVSEIGYATPRDTDGLIFIRRSGNFFPEWEVGAPSARPGDLYQSDTDYWLYIDHDNPEGYGVYVVGVREMNYLNAVNNILIETAEQLGRESVVTQG